MYKTRQRHTLEDKLLGSAKELGLSTETICEWTEWWGPLRPWLRLVSWVQVRCGCPEGVLVWWWGCLVLWCWMLSYSPRRASSCSASCSPDGSVLYEGWWWWWWHPPWTNLLCKQTGGAQVRGEEISDLLRHYLLQTLQTWGQPGEDPCQL